MAEFRPHETADPRTEAQTRRAGGRRGLLATFVLSAGVVLAAGTAFAGPLPLAPHRAVYDLSLLKSDGNRAPVEARGRIVYEFSGNACEGYSTTFRQITEMVPQEGETRVSDMRSTTFESADGKWFRFRVETLSNGRVTKTVEGRADRHEGGLTINLTRPAKKTVETPDDTVFPTVQMLRGIEAARAGKPIFELKVFDGSDSGDKVFRTLNIVGPERRQPAGDEADKQPSMNGMKRWPSVISYFEPGHEDRAPVYVLSFDLWENGVSSNLKLDYGDFQLRGKMTKLEMLKATKCER